MNKSMPKRLLKITSTLFSMWHVLMSTIRSVVKMKAVCIRICLFCDTENYAFNVLPRELFWHFAGCNKRQDLFCRENLIRENCIIATSYSNQKALSWKKQWIARLRIKLELKSIFLNDIYTGDEPSSFVSRISCKCFYLFTGFEYSTRNNGNDSTGQGSDVCQSTRHMKSMCSSM